VNKEERVSKQQRLLTVTEKTKEIPMITVTFVIMKYFLLAHPLLYSFIH